MDPDYESFGRYVKSILKNFIEMGFRTTYVNIMHQGMDAPLALSFRKAAAELSFEMVLEKGHPRGWWADRDRMEQQRAFESRVSVLPMVLPASAPPAGGDHAGYNETSFLLATRPQLVDQSRLNDDAPWYCQKDSANNSWTANAEHGHVMMEAVVQAWVDKIDSER
jgi:creatinine amidohydrolase/Fe(II)-dependent formamide hydrolase-like protein